MNQGNGCSTYIAQTRFATTTTRSACKAVMSLSSVVFYDISLNHASIGRTGFSNAFSFFLVKNFDYF